MINLTADNIWMQLTMAENWFSLYKYFLYRRDLFFNEVYPEIKYIVSEEMIWRYPSIWLLILRFFILLV